MTRPILFWTVAIEPEAKAVRHLRRLQKRHAGPTFDLYHNESEDEWLIRMGVGRVDAAMAIGFLAAKFSHVEQKLFANVGIAGGGGVELGSAWAINKVTEVATGRSYYPGLIPIRGLACRQCHTVDQVERAYGEEVLYDMEAAGFMRATRKLTPTDGVGLLKIVSDTPTHSVEKITKSTITECILSAADKIDLLADNLRAVGQQLSHRHAAPLYLTEALATHRFTASQQLDCRSYCAVGPFFVHTPHLFPFWSSTGHAVLDALEYELDGIPLELSNYD